MKPWKSIQEQIDLLKSRGMLITDEALTKQHLSRIGYYRLSGYYYAFRKRIPVPNMPKLNKKVLDEFIPDVTLKDVVDLYVFDKRLRLLVVDALERIEMAVRVDVAYMLGKRDPRAHETPACLHGNFAKRPIAKGPDAGKTQHQVWLGKRRLPEIE